MTGENRLHSARPAGPLDPTGNSTGRSESLNEDHYERRLFDGSVPLKSRVMKRSIVIGGHRTSVSLEDAFWDGLKEIARIRSVHLSELVNGIDTDRVHCNLSSAIRLYVFHHFHK